jgi:hypothetical protein
MSLISPVIVVPGITASSLQDKYPIDPEGVWSITSKQYTRVTLHPDDTRYELQEPARVMSESLFDIPYQEFIEETRHNLTKKSDEPVPVFPFPYDWRQPLELTEKLLVDLIDEVIGRTKLLGHYHKEGYGIDKPAKVNLVGHSMGGLIIAGYITKKGGDKVDKVVTIGSPFRGSQDVVWQVITGERRSREREAARITPAGYYLLPSYDGAVVADGGLKDNLFEAESWQPSILHTLTEFFRLHGLPKADTNEERARHLLTKMLNDAKAYRLKLENLSLSDKGLSTKDWLCIVGLGEKTRLSLRIQSGADGKPRFDIESEEPINKWEPRRPSVDTGDGTVPYLGSQSAFIPKNEIVCVINDDFSWKEFGDIGLRTLGVGLHGLLPEMNLVQRLTVTHFQGRPQGKIWGRAVPDLDGTWNPPIPGLRREAG